MKILYFIFDGEHPQDGEFHHTERDLFLALNYASRTDKIGMFDATAFAAGQTVLRSDMTADLVREAYESGLLDKDADIAWEHLQVEMTRAEARATQADRERDERVQEAV